MQCCASNIYLDADFVFWIVLEKIALLMVMVGLKIFMAGTPGLDTIMDWFPATVTQLHTAPRGGFLGYLIQ